MVGASQGVADTLVSESGIDRPGTGAQSFDVTNTGGGGMVLRVDGIDVVTTLTDQDTLDGLSCPTGRVAKWDGASWTCATDSDTLGGLVCAGGEIAKWNGASWVCAADVDTDTLGGLSCGPGEIAKLNESLDWVCAAEAEDLCVDAAGEAGVVLDGVCVLDYDNTTSSDWDTASAACVARGGDLCSASQYQTLRNHRPDLFHNAQPVWSRNFSDNDGGVKTSALQSQDDPSMTDPSSYACCGLGTPAPYRGQAETVNGVQVTYLHDQEDTTWDAAARICQARGADLCSKSQYVALNDAGRFSSTVRRATCELSDNDGGSFGTVVGTNASDSGTITQAWAFACCSTARPADGSCPGTTVPGGLCVGEIHETEDADFFTAARACTAVGADVCSKSQMQALRNAGQFIGASWTSDGADNDSMRVGGLAVGQPDNPDPSTTTFGYACCF